MQQKQENDKIQWNQWKRKRGKMLDWSICQMQKANTELLAQVGQFHPVTPLSEVDEDADIPAASHKHACSSPLANEGLRAQEMDDDPALAPKAKAAKVEGNVNQIAEGEFCHNDEEMLDAGLEEFDFPDMDEDEYIAGQTEGAGPPDVSAEKLKELDEQATLDELDKLYRMEVIQSVSPSPEEASNSNIVDTTLVFDWRYRNDSWIRRCRVVARECRTSNTDETSFAPTSAFSAVRMLVFALIYNLAVTALDISDAFLMVPQVEVMFVEIPQWVRTPTVMRHGDLNRKVFINVHVDDILLICKPEDVPRFKQTVGANLKMKIDGPHLLASGEQVMYLKKRITFKEDGILIQPNATYVQS
eukprot:s3453_g5.t1